MSKTSPPSWFKVIVILAILWNLMGIINFCFQITITPDQISKLPEAEESLINSTPFWTYIAFAMGVFGGTIGSIGLLMQKAWSRWLLLLSLIGVFVQMNYWLFFTNAVEVYGTYTYIMPTVVLLVAYLLFSLCNRGIKKGYIT